MKIEKLTLTKVYVNDKDRAGKLFITDKGRKFWKIAVQSEQYKNEYLSCLIFDENDIMFSWKPGQEVKVILERNGNYLNFKKPMQLDYLEARVEALEEFIKSGDKRLVKDDVPMDKAEDDIDLSEIPF